MRTRPVWDCISDSDDATTAKWSASSDDVAKPSLGTHRRPTNIECTISERIFGMQSKFSILKSSSFGLAASVLLVGCGGTDGPPLGSVSGRVTLDGQPLANAVVQFQPTGADGTYSAGRTDEDGYYQLRYTRDRYGALIGSHRVSVSTAAPDAEDEQGNPRPAPERVP